MVVAQGETDAEAYGEADDDDDPGDDESPDEQLARAVPSGR